MLTTITKAKEDIKKVINDAKGYEFYTENTFDDLWLDVESYLDGLATDTEGYIEEYEKTIDELKSALKSIKDSIDEVKSYL